MNRKIPARSRIGEVRAAVGQDGRDETHVSGECRVDVLVQHPGYRGHDVLRAVGLVMARRLAGSAPRSMILAGRARLSRESRRPRAAGRRP